MKKSFKLRTIFNFLFFVALICLTYYIIFRGQDINAIRNLLNNSNKLYLSLGLILMFCYFYMEAFNVKKILEVLGSKISIFKSLKYTFIGFFFSSITPAASGGQPVEIYYMTKDKVRGTNATLALLIHLCSFQIVTIITGIICAIINYDMLKDGFIYLFIVGTSLNFIALLVMMVCIFSRRLAEMFINGIFTIFEALKIKRFDGKKESIIVSLDRYHEGSIFIKEHKIEFVKSILRVILQVIFYYSVPFFVYKSLGLNGYTLIDMFTIQAVLFVSVSSIPLPGAIGISESAFLNIYRTIYGELLLSGAVLLSRLLSFYIFVILSLIVVVFNVIKHMKK
jgi:hypothetical protein